MWPAYWVSALGPARGVKGGSFPPVSAVGVAVGLGGLGVKVLDSGAAALGGGGAVLMGRARASVLPGCHGRVGGVVAGVWRSVAVNVGGGENLLYLRTDWRRRRSLPS